VALLWATDADPLRPVAPWTDVAETWVIANDPEKSKVGLVPVAAVADAWETETEPCPPFLPWTDVLETWVIAREEDPPPRADVADACETVQDPRPPLFAVSAVEDVWETEEIPAPPLRPWTATEEAWATENDPDLSNEGVNSRMATTAQAPSSDDWVQPNVVRAAPVPV